MQLQDIYREMRARGCFGIVDPVGGESLACTAFHDRVQACRAWLRRVSPEPGWPLLFQGDQGPELAVLFWATVAEGRVFVPVDAGWPGYQLAKACRLVQPGLVVVDRPRLHAWLDVDPGCPVVLAPDRALGIDLGVGIGSNDEGVFAGDADPAVAAAAYLFTSGSTGDPKAVVLSHAALARSACLAVESFGWRAGERLLNLADPHTMSGLRNALVAAPLAGMEWLAAPRHARSNVFELLELLAGTRPQRLVAAPVLLRQFNLLGERVDPAAFSALQAVYCTGTDLSHEEVRNFHRRHGLPVVNYYGLTETAGLCLSQDVRHWDPDDDSLGTAIGCELRLVGEDGLSCEGEGPGELQVRQPVPTGGYLHDPEATAALFDGPWLRTGDIARRDAAGRFRIVGRRAHFIKTQGTEKVQPSEVEAVLDQHPGLAESAVLGWRDAAGGERIAALVVEREGSVVPDDAALASFVRERLGDARVPAAFRRVPAIPRSANGKILRHLLGGML